jgi:competence protein ComFC
LTDQAGLQKRPAPGFYRMYQIIWKSLDWLFPPECGGCGRKGCRWCQDCQAKVELIGSIVCPVCGDPQNSAQTCKKCLQIPPAYHSLRSWAAFKGPLREALHHLKYRKDLALGDSLSRPLITYFEGLNWRVDLIVPVPLGKKRIKERGYNQAALLARPLALALSINYSSKGLLRIKDIPSQVGLTIKQRRQNVSGAFWANPDTVSGRRVLIIDDVTTTGATIEACAMALKESGSADIFALTLARAVLGSKASDR